MMLNKYTAFIQQMSVLDGQMVDKVLKNQNL